MSSLKDVDQEDVEETMCGQSWMLATLSCLVLGLSWGCDNCAASRHMYLSKKYMFLQTFSNLENMLAYKEQLFSCLDTREQ